MAMKVLLFQGERSLVGMLRAVLAADCELTAVSYRPGIIWHPNDWQPDLIVLDLGSVEASEEGVA